MQAKEGRHSKQFIDHWSSESLASVRGEGEMEVVVGFIQQYKVKHVVTGWSDFPRGAEGSQLV